MAGKASLSELMGREGAAKSKGRTLTMKDLPDLLGDGMPKLPLNSVGRLRLMRALRQRFGTGFKSIPGVTDIIKDFDGDADLEIAVQKMKSFKGKNNG